MSRPHDRPDDALLATVADLKRRLATLERAARVPQISSIAGGATADYVATDEVPSATVPSWGDLSTVGPSADVRVGRDGLVAWWGCRLQPDGVGFDYSAVMSIEIRNLASDAVIYVPTEQFAAGGHMTYLGEIVPTNFVFVSASPGEYRVRAKYAKTSTWGARVLERRLFVIPL